MLNTAQEWRQKWIAFFKGSKYLLVILERSEESKQKVQVLHVVFEWAKQKNKWMTLTEKPSRMTGGKRTTFRGAERCCKSEWDALPWLKCQRSWRKGQVWAEMEKWIYKLNPKLPKWLTQKSRPRLSGKVAAEPSEGVSVSRNGKTSVRRNENTDKIWKNRVDRSEIKW